MAKKIRIYVYGLAELEQHSAKKFISEIFQIKNYFEAGYARRVERPEQADFILVIGGDGSMLKAIQSLWQHKKPFFGLNFGHIGFLLNDLGHPVNLLNELSDHSIEIIESKLMQIDFKNKRGKVTGTHMAFNDLVIERTKTQTAKIKVIVDGEIHFNPLTCDGIIVSSAAGSTGYNGSAGGFVIPFTTNSLLITGICPAIFENWRSTQLPLNSLIELTPVDKKIRPVRFVVDGQKKQNCHSVSIRSSEQSVQIAFLKSQHFQKKARRLQFNKQINVKET